MLFSEASTRQRHQAHQRMARQLQRQRERSIAARNAAPVPAQSSAIGERGWGSKQRGETRHTPGLKWSLHAQQFAVARPHLAVHTARSGLRGTSARPPARWSSNRHPDGEVARSFAGSSRMHFRRPHRRHVAAARTRVMRSVRLELGVARVLVLEHAGVAEAQHLVGRSGGSHLQPRRGCRTWCGTEAATDAAVAVERSRRARLDVAGAVAKHRYRTQHRSRASSRPHHAHRRGSSFDKPRPANGNAPLAAIAPNSTALITVPACPRGRRSCESTGLPRCGCAQILHQRSVRGAAVAELHLLGGRQAAGGRADHLRGVRLWAIPRSDPDARFRAARRHQQIDRTGHRREAETPACGHRVGAPARGKTSM